MAPFIKKFQPGKLDSWLEGRACARRRGEGRVSSAVALRDPATALARRPAEGRASCLADGGCAAGGERGVSGAAAAASAASSASASAAALASAAASASD